MTRQHAALAVALAVALVLAGCAGTDPGTTTRDGNATTATDATTATTTGPPDASEVQRQVLAAMADVGTYRVELTSNRTLSANGVRQSLTVESEGVFDRDARRLRVNQTTSGPGGSVTVATYVVDRRLYRHSEAFVRQYSSEWITLDLSGNFSATWGSLDTVTRQRATLANASFAVTGTETVGGTEAYVVEADVNETAYNEVVAARLDAADVDVTAASFTVWVSAETYRPLRSEGVVNSTVTGQGQEVAVSERLAVSFDGYGDPVDVSLPGSAETAVSLDNRTTTGSSAATARPHLAPAE